MCRGSEISVVNMIVRAPISGAPEDTQSCEDLCAPWCSASSVFFDVHVNASTSKLRYGIAVSALSQVLPSGLYSDTETFETICFIPQVWTGRKCGSGSVRASTRGGHASLRTHRTMGDTPESVSIGPYSISV